MQITSVYLIATWTLICARDATWLPRVYLGTGDTHNEFPYVVSLQALVNPIVRLCSGSLISETWVLTAGHCIGGIRLIVRYADFSVMPNKTKAFVKVIKIFQHPGFKINKFYVSNDNALILTEKVPNKTLGKVSAVDYKALLGLPVKYAGFGSTHEEFVLKSLSLLELTKDLFRPLYLGEGVVVQCISVRPITGPAICVASKCSKAHQGPRPGDSGGPLVYDGKIVGVLTGSYGHDGPNPMYAPVSPNLQWIHDVMFTHS